MTAQAPRPIRWGVLGTGRIVDRAAEHLREGSDSRVQVIASSDGPRGAARAAELGIPQSCLYDELVERDDLDVVYLALLNHLHVEWTVRLLEAGKHVLCEKPLCATWAEAVRMFEAAERNGRVLAEAFTWPHHPLARRLREITAGAARGEGPLGKLKHIDAWFLTDIAISQPASNRLSHAAQGGALMDLGCYTLGLVRTLAGEEPEEIVANGELAEPLDNDTGAVDAWSDVTGRFPSGVTFSSRCTMLDARGQGVRIEGEEGWAETDIPFRIGSEGATIRFGARGREWEERIEAGGPRMTPQFRAMEAAVRGEAEAVPSAAWSIAQAAWIEEGLRQLGVSFEAVRG